MTICKFKLFFLLSYISNKLDKSIIFHSLQSILNVYKAFCRWLLRKCYTRSHSELGSQAFQRRWYFVLRYGRVGHRRHKQNIYMKIKSSLKSVKKRDLNSKLVRRRGRVYIINKTNPKFKARQK